MGWLGATERAASGDRDARDGTDLALCPQVVSRCADLRGENAHRDKEFSSNGRFDFPGCFVYCILSNCISPSFLA